MNLDLPKLKLGHKQFEKVRRKIYHLCGINLHEGKQEMVKARLMKRLRALGLSSYEEYLNFVEHDTANGELIHMIDVLTTNKTHFFREAQHFEFMKQRIIPEIRRQRRGRIWSAGCSSGEEPYSIAMVLSEELPELGMMDVRILATDLSTQMVERTRQGIYSDKVVSNIPRFLVQKYFTRDPKDAHVYRVTDVLRRLVRAARLNLMDPWPMRGPFDVIFCRNVMIYFDKATQEGLINRFFSMLKPGGFLFVGHSESMAGIAHRFRYVQPAVYVK